MNLSFKGRKIRLSTQQFIGAGGQGEVYAYQGLAIKVFKEGHPPVSLEKIKELRSILSPHILAPEDPVYDLSGNLTGYSMALKNGLPTLCQLMTQTFRKRHDIDHHHIHQILNKMIESIKTIHHHHILIVDLNEFNLLVDLDSWQPVFMDVDSYQTPNFPATALMESVADPRSGQFHKGSDWFAFAILATKLLLGIHPYKGRYTKSMTLRDRMNHGISVFDPRVSIPPICPPLETIPKDFRQWLQQVLQEGLRCSPPTLSSQEAKRLPPKGAGLYIPSISRSLSATIQKDGTLTWQNHTDHLPVLGPIKAQQLMPYNGMLLALMGHQVAVMQFMVTPAGILVTPKIIGQGLPYASHFYHGVMIQHLVQSTFVSIFPDDSTCLQWETPQLNQVKILDAFLRLDQNEVVVECFKDGLQQTIHLPIEDARR